MKIRTHVKAGGGFEDGDRLATNHNETLRVRTALKAGADDCERIALNHNETLRRNSDRPAIAMRREPRTTVRKEDRLELLVIRAGLRAGARFLRHR